MRRWILPRNDGEAVEIERFLLARGETVLVSHQAWGATWQGLESSIRNQIPDGAAVYGIELGGQPTIGGAVNIDHHRYRDEDRWRPDSSLEQVAAILGATLSRWEQLVAANDRGYIPAMEQLGATPEEIRAVRAQDLTAQGLSAEHALQAEDDIRNRAEWRQSRVLVNCPAGSSGYHADQLYGQANEWLLVGPEQWNYSGPRHRLFADQGFPEANWCGGGVQSGYFGIDQPAPESQNRIRHLFWGPEIG